MPFHVRQAVFCLLAAALTLSNASTIDRRSSALFARDDEDPCPSERTTCSVGKGNSKLIRLARRGNLIPRMELPGDDIDKFMYDQTLTARNVVFDDTACTAVHDTLEGNAIDLAVKEMCGCSALILVSEKAVYFTHYFENLAFCGTRENPSNFKREVLDALDNGTPTQASLKAHDTDFKDQPGLAGFIMTPTTGKGTDSLQYKKKIEQLQGKVNGLIGIMPTVVPYKPEDCKKSEVLGTNALGTALYKYDPAHKQEEPQALAKVWVERSDVYDHSWNRPSSTENPTPVVGPFDPPTEPSCYPVPTDKIRDAHKNAAKSAADRFCKAYADKVVNDRTVTIIEEIRPLSAGRIPVIGASDDIYAFTLRSIDNCPSGDSFNLGEPVPGRQCKDIFFDAWKKCKYQSQPFTLLI